MCHEKHSPRQDFISTNLTNEQSRAKWLGLKQDETDSAVSGDKTLTGIEAPDIEEFLIWTTLSKQSFADAGLRNSSLDLKHRHHKL